MAAGIQALLTAMYGFYNAIFQPLLALGPYAALGFFSAVLAGLFSLIYWALLDIERADEIKDKLSRHQEKMKEARSNDNGDKASEHMQKTMELNQRLMKLNIKPMIATMVFVALIFPWLGATFSPTVKMNQTDGKYKGELEYAGQTASIVVDNSTSPATVSAGDSTAQIGEELQALGMTWEIKYFGEKKGGMLSSGRGTVLKLSAKFVQLPFSIPFAGDALNWLGFYIIIAMPLTYIFRKILGVA
ncbi:MAG: EMC3/TMCO1 family protein [Candidatus Nanohaloarchaea archaeon]